MSNKIYCLNEDTTRTIYHIQIKCDTLQLTIVLLIFVSAVIMITLINCLIKMQMGKKAYPFGSVIQFKCIIWVP